MQRGPGVLRVYETGEHTIVGFSNSGGNARSDIPRWHSELVKLVDQHGCRFLTFDLTNLNSLPRAIFDIMFALDQRGVRVQVYNASERFRELMRVTRLDGKVHEVDQLFAKETA